MAMGGMSLFFPGRIAICAPTVLTLLLSVWEPELPFAERLPCSLRQWQ